MNKHGIIEELAKNKTVEEIITNVGGEDYPDADDLAQDLYLDLMMKDEELIQHLYEEKTLKFFISRMVVNNIRSKNSPFFYRYKKDSLNKVDINDVKDKI